MINLLYDLIYMLPLSLVSIIIGGKYAGMPVDKPLFYIALIIFSILLVWFVNTKNKLKYLFLGLLVILMAGIIFIQGERKLEFMLENAYIAYTAADLVLAELIGRISAKVRYVRWGLVLASIVAAAVVLFEKLQISKATVALIFLLLMVYLTEDVQLNWKKAGDTEHKKHLVCVAPFLIITALLVFKAPVKNEPYDWKLFITIWEKTVDVARSVSRFVPWGSNDDYAEVGFSDKSSMNGIIQYYPRELIEAKASQNVGSIVYIAGKSFDHFDGREWFSEKSDAGNYQIMDIVETESAVRKYDKEHFADYIRVGTIDLTYQRFNTKYLFAPVKTIVYGGMLDQVKCVEHQDAIRSAKRVGYGTHYYIRFDRLNLEKDKFYLLMDNLAPLTKKEWDEGVKTATRNSVKNISYDDYIQYVQKVYNDYYDEIVLSPDVKILLEKVCDGAESDYEKLKKIEEWLRTFDYSETPGELPEYLDSESAFLDYFLLESKTGYCVHFATALALLARAEGLPSRFVQGVYVKRGNGSIMITSDMAHAWPEVYIDNFGWVSLEPTPLYHVDNSWITSENIVAKEPVKLNTDYEEPIEDEDIVESGEETEEDKQVPVTVILVLVLVAILFIFTFLASYYALYRRKMAKLTQRELIKLYCKRNIILLGLLGYRMYEHETLNEYRERLIATNTFEKEALSFIACYEEILYSDREADENTLKIIEASFLAIGSKLKLRNGISALIINIRLTFSIMGKLMLK